MAWSETYLCDVCGKTKAEDDPDWWLAWTETITPIPGGVQQPVLKITPWNLLLSHSAEIKHLCGARCAQTHMDRWMASELEQREE